MNQQRFCYVGNWSFQARPSKGKGISLFRHDPETGDLTLIETIRPDIAAGQLCLDEARGILYAVDEIGQRRGEIGGGGYILAFRIDRETGELSLINERETLVAEPSYICLDKTGKYLTVCHCADPFHVTKIVRRTDGTFGNEVVFDDTALTMFRVNDDGSLGDICDIAVTEGTGGKGPRSRVNIDPLSGHIQLVEVISRLHSVVASPRADLMAVCDKGMDRIHTFRVDRENGLLLRLFTWNAEEAACFPRYCAFHPTLPMLYANNESVASLNVFVVDEKTGELVPSGSCFMLTEDPGLVDGKEVGAQDILIRPDGRTLYCTLVGLNLIIVCTLDENGVPTVMQRIPTRGRMPRGLGLSPDGHFMYSGNMLSGDITVFAVDENGRLTDTDKTVEAVSPSAIRFYPTGR